MSDELKKQIDQLKADSLAALKNFHHNVSPEELRARVGDTTCSVLINEDFVICYATPPLEKLFDYESQQLEGQHINVLLPARFHMSHLRHLPTYADHPERRDMSHRPELRGITSKGVEFGARIQLAPVFWHGATYFMAEVFEVKPD